MNLAIATGRSARTPRVCAALGLIFSSVFGCGEKQGSTTETEISTGGVSSPPVPTETAVTDMTTINTGTTGNPVCQAIPSTPCGDYIGALACCGIESVDDEAGAFLTEECNAYTKTAPGNCGALVTAALVCLRPLPCEELLAFRASYEAGTGAWKTSACSEQVKAAVATNCADLWAVR